MAATNPTIEAWRQAIAALGSRLVELEANTAVTLARTGCLVGASAQAWNAVDADVALAWETYRALDGLMDEVDRDLSRAAAVLTASVVPAPGGPANPTGAIRAAKAAADAGVELAGRFSVAWGDTSKRLAAARSAAEVAGDPAATRAAGALAALLATDPFAVTESDIAAVERLAAGATDRRSAAQLATRRLDLDLAQARSSLDTLRADVTAAGDELDHAVSRIVGVVKVEPVRDLEALAKRLDDIVNSSGADPTRAAAELRDSIPAAAARRAELAAALAPARDGLRRRENGRGLWAALRAKAAAKHLDERDDVTQALEAAKDALWRAPCDLDAAEGALARVASLLQDDGRMERQ